MSKKIGIFLVAALLSSLLIGPVAVLAQTAGNKGTPPEYELLCGKRPASGAPLGDQLSYWVCLVTRLTTAIAVLIIMVVGVMYIIGAFKADTATTAKTILLTTITGLLFLYLTSFIINVLAKTGILTNVAGGGP